MHRYGFPVVFAAALHSIILFGFNCRPFKATVAKDSPIECILPMPPAEIEVIESSSDPSPPAIAEFDMPPFALPDPTCCLCIPPFEILPIIARPSLVRVVSEPRITVTVQHQEPYAFGDIIPSTLLDRLPSPRRQVAPDYPFTTRQGRPSDEVVVEFVVDERGDVVQAKIVKSTDSTFDAPTLQAIMKWKFEPGLRHGRVVPFRMTIPVVFNLND